MGHNEKRRWKVEEWIKDQKIDFELDDLFQELIAREANAVNSKMERLNRSTRKKRSFTRGSF
ncbi:MAG: hypothetical protein QXN34_03915 [Archaeoglobaceae archaeon]